MQNINANYLLPVKPSRWVISVFIFFMLMVSIAMLVSHEKNRPPETNNNPQKESVSSTIKTGTKPEKKAEQSHVRATTKKEENEDADNPYIINTEQAAHLRAALLPKPHGKHLPVLLPPPLPMTSPTTPAPVAAPAVTQRCNYKGQTYVPGDIVKADEGWIRCTPTLFFTPDNPTRQSGSAAWTVVQ